MELKIQIDEVMFKDVIEKELNAFSKEELHAIVRECIVHAMQNEELFKSLFIQKRVHGCYSAPQTEPTQLMFDAAKTFDLSPAFQEIQAKMIDELKTNYKNIIETVMLRTIVNGLCYTSDFQSSMEEAVYKILAQNKNQ